MYELSLSQMPLHTVGLQHCQLMISPLDTNQESLTLMLIFYPDYPHILFKSRQFRIFLKKLQLPFVMLGLHYVVQKPVCQLNSQVIFLSVLVQMLREMSYQDWIYVQEKYHILRQFIYWVRNKNTSNVRTSRLTTLDDVLFSDLLSGRNNLPRRNS